MVCLDTEKIEESDGFGMKFLYDHLGLGGISFSGSAKLGNRITFSMIDLRNGGFSDYKFIMELVCFSGLPLLKNETLKLKPKFSS